MFAAMFGHDTLEAKTNRVVITDVDYETMQKLLKFIYCEKVSDLKKLALNLLPAADKVFKFNKILTIQLIKFKFFSTI